MLYLHTTQTFELLTGRWLFNPQSGPTWSTEDDHLAKMMELTGQQFSKAVLERSTRRNEYFDVKGIFYVIHSTQRVPIFRRYSI